MAVYICPECGTARPRAFLCGKCDKCLACCKCKNPVPLSPEPTEEDYEAVEEIPEYINFEKGKQLIIEGFEEFIKLYFPYLKAIEGLRLLGLSDILSPAKEDEDKLIKIGLDSLIGGLKQATTREEIREVIEQNEDFWKIIRG